MILTLYDRSMYSRGSSNLSLLSALIAMTEKINERVDVITIYRKSGAIVMPYKIRWNSKEYLIKKLGYHFKEKEGKTIIHVFSVSNDSLSFRLRFNSDTLSWILEEVLDGNGATA